MIVQESQLPPAMLECAKRIRDAYWKQLYSTDPCSWHILSQKERDAWCATAVAAFQLVVEGTAARIR